MHLDDCYRLLEIDPGAPDEEVKRAHRDLTKVWHPDRFAHDPSLRKKAEEKIKAINAAYETITSAREEGGRGSGGRRTRRPSPGDPRDQLRRYRTWAATCILFATVVLLRRPTAAGLVLAAILFGAAILLLVSTRPLPR